MIDRAQKVSPYNKYIFPHPKNFKNINFNILKMNEEEMMIT